MNKTFPDFSVVIPAYNSLELFRGALHSVLMQKGVSLSIIVTDDSVHSDIEEYVCQSDLPQVHYLRNKPPKGAVKNWNFGLSKAKGDYTILLHHDERLPDPDFLKNALAQLRNDGLDLLISDTVVHLPGNVRSEVSSVLKRFILKYFPSLIYAFNLIGPTACVIFKRERFEPFNEKLKWLVDADWYFRMMKKSKTGFNTQLPVISLFGHSTQISLTLEREQVEKEDQAVIKNNIAPFSQVALCLELRNLIRFLKRKFHLEKNPFRNYADC